MLFYFIFYLCACAYSDLPLLIWVRGTLPSGVDKIRASAMSFQKAPSKATNIIDQTNHWRGLCVQAAALKLSSQAAISTAMQYIRCVVVQS